MKAEIQFTPDHGTLAALLEGLVLLNVYLLGVHPLPPLYASGVRYKREPIGQEKWKAANLVFRDRFGDCEDLSGWRAAELRRAGVDAEVIAIRSGRKQWHAVVLLPDGNIEDPSRRLGMGKK